MCIYWLYARDALRRIRVYVNKRERRLKGRGCLRSTHLRVVATTTTSGLWVASDHRRLGMASGHLASNETEAINKFIHNRRST